MTLDQAQARSLCAGQVVTAGGDPGSRRTRRALELTPATRVRCVDLSCNVCFADVQEDASIYVDAEGRRWIAARAPAGAAVIRDGTHVDGDPRDPETWRRVYDRITGRSQERTTPTGGDQMDERHTGARHGLLGPDASGPTETQLQAAKNHLLQLFTAWNGRPDRERLTEPGAAFLTGAMLDPSARNIGQDGTLRLNIRHPDGQGAGPGGTYQFNLGMLLMLAIDGAAGEREEAPKPEQFDGLLERIDRVLEDAQDRTNEIRNTRALTDMADVRAAVQNAVDEIRSVERALEDADGACDEMYLSATEARDAAEGLCGVVATLQNLRNEVRREKQRLA